IFGQCTSPTISSPSHFSDQRQNSTVSSEENVVLDLSIHNRRSKTTTTTSTTVTGKKFVTVSNRLGDSQDAPVIDQYSPATTTATTDYGNENENPEEPSFVDVLNDDPCGNDVSKKFDFRHLAETIDGRVSKSTTNQSPIFPTRDVTFLNRLCRRDFSPPEEPSSTSSCFFGRWSFPQNPVSPTNVIGSGAENLVHRTASRRPKKQYVCAYCGRQFSKSYNLMIHERTASSNF
uniref:C2H2-type domain-containing protein n=1 Tax=Romanomermis culicivorax TaxID=13658 RepID=A0A915HLR0_ROMCU